MKKLTILLTSILLITELVSNSTIAQQLNNEENVIQSSKLRLHSIAKILDDNQKQEKQACKEIKNFIKDYNKVLKKNDLITLSRFYDKDYKNTDGYDLAELMAMISKTTKAFDDIRYKTKITQIDVREDNAAVQLEDVTTAKVYPSTKTKNKSKIGYLEGKSSSIMQLKKIDGMWRILQDSTLSEETALKYGVARKIAINLDAPQSVENGQDYGVTLNLKTPNRLIALGSIAREEVNSQEKHDDKFRRISSNGQLERLVKANENNKDEYAIASVGFTKVYLNKKQKKARIELLGLAYMMKRVNMNHLELTKNDEDNKVIKKENITLNTTRAQNFKKLSKRSKKE